MRKLIVLLFLLYLIFEAPIVLNAQEKIPAGFPVQSIWISKSSVTEGDSVDIYTAVYNAGSESLRGSVSFRVDTKEIGKKEFQLDAGKAGLLFVSWRATAGPHTFGATIVNASGAKAGEGVSLSSGNSGSLSVIVASAPPPSMIEQGVKTVVQAANDATSVAAPVIVSAGKSLFDTTELFRKSALEFAKQNQHSKKPGAATSTAPARESQIAGANIVIPPQNNENSLFSKLSQLAAPAILFTFATPAIFYPFLCLVLLAVIYGLGKLVRRPQKF
jgi:hypothetical protein